jgi:hypothetical protein
LASAVLVGVVSWLVGESLKNGAQIFGQQFSMGVPITVGTGPRLDSLFLAGKTGAFVQRLSRKWLNLDFIVHTFLRALVHTIEPASDALSL